MGHNLTLCIGKLWIASGLWVTMESTKFRTHLCLEEYERFKFGDWRDLPEPWKPWKKPWIRLVAHGISFNLDHLPDRKVARARFGYWIRMELSESLKGTGYFNGIIQSTNGVISTYNWYNSGHNCSSFRFRLHLFFNCQPSIQNGHSLVRNSLHHLPLPRIPQWTHNPYAPSMEYLPTFTPKIAQFCR